MLTSLHFRTIFSLCCQFTQISLIFNCIVSEECGGGPLVSILHSLILKILFILHENLEFLPFSEGYCHCPRHLSVCPSVHVYGWLYFLWMLLSCTLTIMKLPFSGSTYHTEGSSVKGIFLTCHKSLETAICALLLMFP